MIYPGKGHDDWWDLKQLMAAMVHTIAIFEVTKERSVYFNLTALLALHMKALLLTLNKMNINPGGKQPLICHYPS